MKIPRWVWKSVAALPFLGLGSCTPPPPAAKAQQAGPVVITSTPVPRQLQFRVPQDLSALEAHIRGDFEQSWPEYTGKIVFTTLAASGNAGESQADLATKLAKQFWRSPEGRGYAGDELDRQKIAEELRAEAGRLAAQIKTDDPDRVTYATGDSRTVRLPDGKGDFMQWGYVYMAMCESCDFYRSAAVLSHERVPAHCEYRHPDHPFLHEMRRLGVAYHELMHGVAKLQNLPASAFQTLADINHEEVRAKLVESYSLIRHFGPKALPIIEAVAIEAVRDGIPQRYYNPYTYEVARESLYNGLAAKLQGMNLREMFAIATHHAAVHPLNDIEATALRNLSRMNQQLSAADRVEIYEGRPAASANNFYMPLQGGRLEAYPEVAYRHDQLLLSGVQPLPHLGWAAQFNPYRTPAYRGVPLLAVPENNPAALAALQAYNNKLYGAKACVLPLPKPAT